MSQPRFNDDNTLEDIFGCIFVAQSWPTDSDPDDPPISEQLDAIIMRIEDKLARNNNRIRHNWFSTALDFARQARVAYVADDSQRGYSLLEQCREYLESGNKAHRRKTSFIVAPDGVAHPVTPSSTPNPNEPSA